MHSLSSFLSNLNTNGIESCTISLLGAATACCQNKLNFEDADLYFKIFTMQLKKTATSKTRRQLFLNNKEERYITFDSLIKKRIIPSIFIFNCPEKLYLLLDNFSRFFLRRASIMPRLLIFEPIFERKSIKNKNNALKIWLVPTCFCYFAPDLYHRTHN